MSVRSPRWGVVLSAVLALAAAGRAAEPPDDLDALQKRLLQMMLREQPKPDELARMVAEMNRLMRQRMQDERRPEWPRPGLRVPPGDPDPAQLLDRPPRKPLPLGLPIPDLGAPEFVDPQPVLNPADDKKLKEFDELIEKLKDDPDAQAEVKKARDEYKRALEEGLRKAERNGENLRPARPDPLPNIDVPVFPNNRFGLDPFAGRIGGPPRLGVVIEKPSALLAEHLNLPADVGVVVVEIQPGSPAEKAGLRPNDVVIRLGGKDAPSELTRFQQLVSGLKAGEKVEAVVYRRGKKETVGGIELSPLKR